MHTASIYSYIGVLLCIFQVMVTTCSCIIVWMLNMWFKFFVYEHVMVIVVWKALQYVVVLCNQRLGLESSLRISHDLLGTIRSCSTMKNGFFHPHRVGCLLKISKCRNPRSMWPEMLECSDLNMRWSEMGCGSTCPDLSFRHQFLSIQTGLEVQNV